MAPQVLREPKIQGQQITIKRKRGQSRKILSLQRKGQRQILARPVEVRSDTNYIAGGLKGMQKYWYKITSDPEVISIISEGVKIKFEDFIPTNSPFQYKRSKLETLVMDKEIQKLLDMGAISVCTNEEGYFSNMFTKQKSDGSYRCILNLKSLNPHCQKSKFKMASIRDVLHMIKPNHYLASIDYEKCIFFCAN